MIEKMSPPENRVVNSEALLRLRAAFLTHLATKDGFKWELEEEITKGTLLCKDGQIINHQPESLKSNS
jgi:hypothetical protein